MEDRQLDKTYHNNIYGVYEHTSGPTDQFYGPALPYYSYGVG